MLTVIWDPGKRSNLIIAEWIREGFFKDLSAWVETAGLSGSFPVNKEMWKKEKEKGNGKGKDMGVRNHSHGWK